MPEEEVVFKHAPAVERNYTKRRFSIQFDSKMTAAEREDVKAFMHRELDIFIDDLKKGTRTE